MKLLSSLKNIFPNKPIRFKAVVCFVTLFLFISLIFAPKQAYAKYDRIRYDKDVQVLTGTKKDGFLALPDGYPDAVLWNNVEANDNVELAVSVISSTLSAAAMSVALFVPAQAKVYQDYSILVPFLGGGLQGALHYAGYLTSAFSIRYGNSVDAYRKLKLCGDDWFSYKEVDFSGYDMPVVDGFERSYAKKIKDCLMQGLKCTENNISSELSFSNKAYREYIYQGMEYEDSSCLDPNNKPQKYYFKGKFGVNFACERFIYNGTGDYDKYRESLKCCRDREKNYTCVTDGETHKLCKIGSECEISKVELEVYRSKKNAAKICTKVKPRSIYPFGFNVSGGTEDCIKFDSSTVYKSDDIEANYSKCSNFYQLDRHCIVSSVKYYRQLDLPSIYLDKSCSDFISNTMYTPNYQYKELLLEKGATDLQTKSLSATVVQCLKESLQNMMNNEIGYSLCTKVNEDGNQVFVFSDESGCPEGFNLRYLKGWKADSLSIEPQYRKISIIGQIQKLVRNIVLLILYLSVTLYGYNILKAGGNIDKNALMVYLFKIAVVVYIVFSSAWVDTFIVQIYNASTTIARVVPNIAESDKEYERDGCQFGPNYNLNHSYYGDKVYLEVFDTLDCKLNKYLGGGASDAAFSVVKMMVANLVPYIGPVNYYIFLGVFLVMLNLILLVLKVIYAFVASFIGILIGAFLLPILIPTILFGRTKGMINVWGKYMLRYVLYPPLLFAYLMMVFQIYDYVLAGSSVYLGAAPVKELHCGEYYEAPDGKISLIDYGTGVSGNSSGNLICLFDGGDIEDSFNFPIPIVGKLLDLLGISFLLQAMSFIVAAGLLKMIITIMQAVIATYIFEKMLDIVPALIGEVVGGIPEEEGFAGGTLRRLGSLEKISLRRIGDAVKRASSRFARKAFAKKAGKGIPGSASRGASPVSKGGVSRGTPADNLQAANARAVGGGTPADSLHQAANAGAVGDSTGDNNT